MCNARKIIMSVRVVSLSPHATTINNVIDKLISICTLSAPVNHILMSDVLVMIPCAINPVVHRCGFLGMTIFTSAKIVMSKYGSSGYGTWSSLSLSHMPSALIRSLLCVPSKRILSIGGCGANLYFAKNC